MGIPQDLLWFVGLMLFESVFPVCSRLFLSLRYQCYTSTPTWHVEKFPHLLEVLDLSPLRSLHMLAAAAETRLTRVSVVPVLSWVLQVRLSNFRFPNPPHEPSFLKLCAVDSLATELDRYALRPNCPPFAYGRLGRVLFPPVSSCFLKHYTHAARSNRPTGPLAPPYLATPATSTLTAPE
ncbi:hypothetical protein BJX76DRAFT_69843 [Aspergillus varians]